MSIYIICIYKIKTASDKKCILHYVTFTRDKCIEKSLDFAINCYFLRRMCVWVMGTKGTFLSYSAYLCIVWITEGRMFSITMHLFKTIYKMAKSGLTIDRLMETWCLTIYVFFLFITSQPHQRKQFIEVG